jgi:foldase protein PrsA
MLRSALTVLAVAATGLLADGAWASDPVAIVDGQGIERQEFEHWMTVAAKSTGQHTAVVPDPATGYRVCIATKRKAMPVKDRRKVTDTRLRKQCEEELGQLRSQALQLLISFKWIEGEAAAQQITVSDAEVERAFQEQRRQSFPTDADFQRFLEQSGQRLEDILRRMRLDLLSNKIREKVVAGHDQVPAQAIEQFYADNERRFLLPETRALRIVLTKRKAEAERARAALERGASWKAVARRYSIDGDTKRHGGKLPGQAKGTLDRPLDKAVFSAARRRLVGPVRTDYGYYVFTVTKIEKARQARFAEVREAIRETLVSQAQQKALDAFVKDFTARWRAKTECVADLITSDCRNGPAPTHGPPA